MNDASRCWYIRGEGNQPAGPFVAEQLIQSWRAGRLDANTICWCEGMSQWLPLSQVEPFASAIASTNVARPAITGASRSSELRAAAPSSESHPAVGCTSVVSGHEVNENALDFLSGPKHTNSTPNKRFGIATTRNRSQQNPLPWLMIGGGLVALLIGGGVVVYTSGLIGSGEASSHHRVSGAATKTPAISYVPTIKVGCGQLQRDYVGNEVAADHEYKGHRIDIDGFVDSIHNDPILGIYIVLSGDLVTPEVRCSFEKKEAGNVANLHRGFARIRGTCLGQSLGYITVDECEVVKFPEEAQDARPLALTPAKFPEELPERSQQKPTSTPEPNRPTPRPHQPTPGIMVAPPIGKTPHPEADQPTLPITAVPPIGETPDSKGTLSGTWRASTGAVFRIEDDGTTASIELISSDFLQAFSGGLTRGDDEPGSKSFTGTVKALFRPDAPRRYSIHLTASLDDSNQLRLRCADWPVWNKAGRKIGTKLLTETWTRSDRARHGRVTEMVNRSANDVVLPRP